MALHRDLIHVSGADALSFLQGQLAADLEAGDGCRWSLLLEPNGKVVALLLVRTIGGEVDLSVEAGQGEDVLARLERFKLRTDASFTMRAATVARAPLTGPAPEGSWVHRWGGVELVDVEVPAGGPELADDELRVKLGLPATGVDLDGELFANALGPEGLAASVSSTKGCYTGQELVARTSSRGTAAPELLVHLEGKGETPPAGTPLEDAEGTAVGRLTTVVPSAAGWAGIGRLRRGALAGPTTCGPQAVTATPLS